MVWSENVRKSQTLRKSVSSMEEKEYSNSLGELSIRPNEQTSIAMGMLIASVS